MNHRDAFAEIFLQHLSQCLHTPFFVGGSYALEKWMRTNNLNITASEWKDGDLDVFIPLPNVWQTENKELLAQLKECMYPGVGYAPQKSEENEILRRLRHVIELTLQRVTFTLCALGAPVATSQQLAAVSRVPNSCTVGRYCIGGHLSVDVIVFYRSDFVAAPITDIYKDFLGTFDLDICRVGFSVNDNVLMKPTNLGCGVETNANKRAAIEAMLGVMRRKGVCRDVRRIICQLCAAFYWTTITQWHYAPTWNRSAVENPSQVPAVLHWELSSSKMNPEVGNFNETAGVERIEKYTKRGFRVADFPARTNVLRELLAFRTTIRAAKRAKEARKNRETLTELAKMTKTLHEEWNTK